MVSFLVFLIVIAADLWIFYLLCQVLPPLLAGIAAAAIYMLWLYWETVEAVPAPADLDREQLKFDENDDPTTTLRADECNYLGRYI